MIYNICPGIIMLKVCDTHLLVAKRELWKNFPRVRPIPRKHALIWFLMEKGRNSEEVMLAFSELFNKSIDDIHQQFDPVLNQLAEEGYLIPVENNHK